MQCGGSLPRDNRPRTFIAITLLVTPQLLSIQPGPDAFTIVPNTTLAVARTAYKNNSSKYTINERASNYKEVQTLLKGRGIDLDHNRFLILQVGSLRLRT